ncbi:hypothetical protein MAR_013154 [Mya arenaria]|uniref:Uncharacterized protein n=1 Tax=Mya arenaria TaxID=6604 RepID=A0ABY7FZQ1_MYAAR|nr:hypothetical protein MAR_013154 [Mya arenaria]
MTTSSSSRGTSCFPLTQNSPPPRQLFTATKQASLDQFFGTAEEPAFEHELHFNTEDNNSDETHEDTNSSRQPRQRCAKALQMEEDENKSKTNIIDVYECEPDRAKYVNEWLSSKYVDPTVDPVRNHHGDGTRYEVKERSSNSTPPQANFAVIPPPGKRKRSGADNEEDLSSCKRKAICYDSRNEHGYDESLPKDQRTDKNDLEFSNDSAGKQSPEKETSRINKNINSQIDGLTDTISNSDDDSQQCSSTKTNEFLDLNVNGDHPATGIAVKQNNLSQTRTEIETDDIGASLDLGSLQNTAVLSLDASLHFESELPLSQTGSRVKEYLSIILEMNTCQTDNQHVHNTFTWHYCGVLHD